MHWVLAIGCQLTRATPSEVESKVAEEPTRATHVGDEARAAALGDISGIDDPVLLEVLDTTAFSPLGPAGPSDWLALHDEQGQTWQTYVDEHRVAPTPERRRLQLQPLGELAPGLDLEGLRAATEAFFGLPAVVLPALSDEGLVRRQHRGREQILTTSVLVRLAEELPADAMSTLAITSHDLYPEEAWNFVFGQASYTHRVGVFSLHRYDPAFYGRPPDEALVMRRALKVLAHEQGHMFGLRHCVYYDCLMNGSNHLEEADSRPLHLCPICLRKLHSAIGFDVKKRFANWAAVLEALGLDTEARWARSRID